jgi:hypothetical protein
MFANFVEMTTIEKAFILAGIGMLGVFLMLTIYFILIKVLPLIFRD